MSFDYDYTRLLVSNFEACFLFYRDMMGLPVRRGTEEDTYAEFELGETSLSLFDRNMMAEAIGAADRPDPGKAKDRFCLVFQVEDVNATCEKLRGLGVTMTAEPTDRPDWNIRTAHFRDPDGNLIEVNQPLQD